MLGAVLRARVPVVGQADCVRLSEMGRKRVIGIVCYLVHTVAAGSATANDGVRVGLGLRRGGAEVKRVAHFQGGFSLLLGGIVQVEIVGVEDFGRAVGGLVAGGFGAGGV